LQAEETLPKVPCIVVRNFPDSWQDSQVKLVFALFGGVSAVRFALGADAKRMAHVEFKKAENMAKAVDQLHLTHVGDGDLIEECTISCELSGSAKQSTPAPAGPLRRVLFVDELPMLKRPDLPPSRKEQEVYLTSLPVEECNEEQIKSWLEGFGVVDDMFLLRDDRTGKFSGRGYARFKTHEQANACVEATREDADDGDIVAVWSESERASQRASGAYGIDPHTAFAGPSGRVLSAILGAAKLKAAVLWMFSELYPNRDRGAPQPEGKRLHFIATCTDEQFGQLRSALASALQSFHEKVAKRLREAKEAKEREAKEREREREGKQRQQPPPAWQLGPPPGRPSGRLVRLAAGTASRA